MTPLTPAPLTQQLDAYVADLVQQGVPRDRAEEAVRTAFGVADEPPVVDEAALEKGIVFEGDRLMRAHGFTVVAFSQPRATKQTPGIPDRRYYRPLTAWPGHGLVCWWEAKTATGVQSPAQQEFQRMAEACGETYILGTHAALYAWLAARGVVGADTPRPTGGVKRLAGPIEAGGGMCPPMYLPNFGGDEKVEIAGGGL